MNSSRPTGRVVSLLEGVEGEVAELLNVANLRHRSALVNLAPFAATALVVAGCTPVQPLRTVEAVASSLTDLREPPPLSAGDLRQLQTRDIPAPKDIAFAATMTVLLDLGYRLQSADITTGLIVASASSTDRLKLDLRGLSTARQVPMASVFVESISLRVSRVRVQLTVGTSSSASIAAAERGVRLEAPYREFFSELQREVTERQLSLPDVESTSARSETTPAAGPSLPEPPTHGDSAEHVLELPRSDDDQDHDATEWQDTSPESEESA